MTLPWMAAKIVLRPVAELRPHAGNARVHSAAQLEQIKASMLAFGFTNPLLVDEDGAVATAYGAWGEKVLYGRTVIGMTRVVPVATSTRWIFPPIGTMSDWPSGMNA